MGNFLDSDKSQGVFLSVIPEEQITDGSFDETVQFLIDDVLDVSHFESVYKNDKGGAPAYPPSSLLKVILAAYSRGITSSRKIEHLCQYHTVFMCLSGFLTPDHSTIAAFVSKSSEAIEKLFIQVVLECDHLGLIGGNSFSIDGTKLSSNASKEQSGTRTDFEKKYKKVKHAIQYLLKQHRHEDKKGSVDPERRGREKKRIKTLREIAKKLEQPILEMEERLGSSGKPIKSNLTDDDSHTMMSGAGGAIQGYVGLAIGDDQYQVITAADIADTTEQNSFIPLVEKMSECLGIALKDTEILADAGFHSEANVNYCYDQEVVAYIADNKMRKRDPRYVDQEDKKPRSRQQQYFRAEDFYYDADTNSCQCPAGKLMWLACDNYILNGQRYRKFTGYLDDCRKCPFQKSCMRQPPKDQGRQVSLRKGRADNPPRPIDLMKEKVDTPVGRDRYANRIGTIEPIFAHIKHTLGLRWLSLRGLKKVKGQWWLYCMVHNMAKIQRYGEYEVV